MDNRIFNVRTGVNACDCALGCTDTVRESALKVDSGRKIPCRTGESNLRQRRVGPMLYQLSYNPSPVSVSPRLFFLFDQFIGISSDQLPEVCIAWNAGACVGCEFDQRAGIAGWLERRTRDRKVASSNTGRMGGRILFSTINRVC